MLLPIPPQPAPAASLISSAERRCRAQRAELGEGEEERRGDGETEGEGMLRQPFYRAAWKQAGTQDHAATTKTAAAIKKSKRQKHNATMGASDSDPCSCFSVLTDSSPTLYHSLCDCDKRRTGLSCSTKVKQCACFSLLTR